jgi:hypothetical protein
MSTASTANLEVWNAGDAGVVGLLHLAKKLRADGEDHLGDQTMDPQHPSGPAAVPIITTVAAVVAESRQPEPAPAAPAAAVAAQTAGAHRRIAPLSPPPLQRGYIHIGRSSPRAPDTRFRSARAGGDSAATPVDPDGDGAFASRPLPFTLSRCLRMLSIAVAAADSGSSGLCRPEPAGRPAPRLLVPHARQGAPTSVNTETADPRQ